MDAPLNERAAGIAAGGPESDAAFLRGECDKNNANGYKRQEKLPLLDSKEPGALLVLRSLVSPFKENGGIVYRRRRLAKLVKRGGDPTGIVPYEGAKHFQSFGLDASDFDKLYRLIGSLLGKPSEAVVQGGRLDSADPRRMQRLIYDTPDHDHREIIYPATIFDKPSLILPIDIDDLQPPPEVRGLLATGLWARALLLPEFHGARCIVIATASYGFHHGAHIRLWFMLDRPLTCAEKRRWLRSLKKIGFVKFVDTGLYSANQLVYTSGPVFEGDAEFDDPLFDMPRLVVIDGQEFVRTPRAETLKSSPHPSYRTPSFHIDAAGRDTSYGISTLGSALYLIYRAPNKPERPRHEWIRIACHMVAQPILLGMLNADSALEQLIAAAVSIGGSGEKRDWARETRNLFDWALRVEAAGIALENGGSRHEEE